MKKKLTIIGLTLTMLFSVGYLNRAQAHTTVSFNLFFDALAPYGNWVSTPDYGYVWSPTDVGQEWEPYTNGHWVWSDYGWTWVSYEPWGWVPFHYGRWVYTDYYGWIWIPGTVWAPAWVTWYTGPDYIGWAPLPPDDRFSLEVGISFSNHNYYVPPRDVVFVPSDSFLSTGIRDVVIPRSRNVTIIRNTRDVNNVTIVNNKVINRGPDVNFVEKVTRTRVEKVNLFDRDIDQRTIVKGDVSVNQMKGKELYVFRPDVVKKGNESPVIRRKFERNRNETIQNQENFENQTNQRHPVFSRNVENNPGEIRNKNQEVNPPSDKKIRKKETLENPNNPQNPNQYKQYPMRWDNSTENHFVRQNTVQSQGPDIHSENRYPVYRNTEKQFPPRGPSSANFKQYFQSNSDAKERKFQKRDFRQRSNSNGNLDSRRNQKQTDRNG